MAEGREGDWECSGCKNRNYAFRSFCNRCRQPRLLVDTKTPADSKWLPRIGDWICTGCTNNNYASREKCKKCGQAKQIAAMPPGNSYLGPRPQGGLPDPKLNFGLMRNGGAPQQLLLPPLNNNWSVAGANQYGVQLPSALSLGGMHNVGLPYPNPANQPLSAPTGFRSGDWICSCGFHNYQSRTQCKKCDAFPPAPGMKRLASEEFVHDWDNKRLNLGHAIGQQQSHQGFEQVARINGNPGTGPYAPYPSMSSGVAPTLQVPMPSAHQATPPALFGKGAKQWRDGDWMCTNCDNHNYASRLNCNRCKTERVGAVPPVNVM